MSLLVTNVEWGCEVFPECLRPTITAAQQRVPGTVYEMTRITSLHPHCHLKREVLSSVLSADWESEAQRGLAVYPRSHRAMNVTTLGFELRST